MSEPTICQKAFVVLITAEHKKNPKKYPHEHAQAIEAQFEALKKEK